MPVMSDVNWLAAIVGAVAFFALGALWYGPLFGKMWSAGMGLDPSSMSAAKSGYAITFVAALVLSVAVSALVADAATTTEALSEAAFLWVGLVATTAAINATWDARPWSVYAVNVGYHLAGLLIVALVTSMWPA